MSSMATFNKCRNNSYRDRFGNLWLPQRDSICKQRSGAFGISFNRHRKLLLTYPEFDPHWPQLPGGGIEVGEDPIQALLREYNEEVGRVRSIKTAALGQYQFLYYADDKKEFWRYTQYYFWVEINDAAIPHFGRWPSPEGAWAAWRHCSVLMPLHYIHKKVLLRLLRTQAVAF